MSWKGDKEMSSLIDSCRDLENEIQVRITNASDRQHAADMLSLHYTGQPGMFPADFLPETGIAATLHGKTLCIIPVYLEQSSTVAVLGHFIADDQVNRKRLRLAAIKAIEAAKRFAKAAGKKHLVSIFGRRSINRIADGLGFKNADRIEEKICYIGGN